MDKIKGKGLLILPCLALRRADNNDLELTEGNHKEKC
jgi:hypothetical protein